MSTFIKASDLKLNSIILNSNDKMCRVTKLELGDVSANSAIIYVTLNHSQHFATSATLEIEVFSDSDFNNEINPNFDPMANWSELT